MWTVNVKSRLIINIVRPFGVGGFLHCAPEVIFPGVTNDHHLWSLHKVYLWRSPQHTQQIDFMVPSHYLNNYAPTRPHKMIWSKMLSTSRSCFDSRKFLNYRLLGICHVGSKRYQTKLHLHQPIPTLCHPAGYWVMNVKANFMRAMKICVDSAWAITSVYYELFTCALNCPQ